jgi:hypothetical protein
MDRKGVIFERQVFSGVPQLAEILALPPQVRRALLVDGVPNKFFFRNYSADLDITVVRLDGCPPLVRFGSDSRGVIGVDSASGRVICVDDRRGPRITFINTEVGKFTETARLLAERFPYGISHDWLEEAGEAAAVMREIIRSIDAEAAVPGAYWADYPDEVAGWLYSLEEVQRWQQGRLSPPLGDSTDPARSGIDAPDGRLF